MTELDTRTDGPQEPELRRLIPIGQQQASGFTFLIMNMRKMITEFSYDMVENGAGNKRGEDLIKIAYVPF